MPTPAEHPNKPNSNSLARTLTKAAALLLGLLLALLLISAALLNYAVRYDKGTRLLWNASTRLFHNSLSGNYVSGNLLHGLHLEKVAYHNSTLRIDLSSLAGSWNIDWQQRRLNVSWLHLGMLAIDDTSPSSPTTLPQQIQLPLALTLNDIRLQQLRYGQGTGALELSKLQLHGKSDGTTHALTLETLTTPYGIAQADLQLSGKRPFALDGSLQLRGIIDTDKSAPKGEQYLLDAKLSGSLEALNIALAASGDKLQGKAQIVATPFAALPFQTARIDLLHINPQAFNAAAPKADISLHADLQPLASPTTPLSVGGKVSASNALPGALDRQRLPLLSASADVQMNQTTQTLTALNVRLPGNGQLSGNGSLKDGTGAFTLQASSLNLQSLYGALAASRLQGPLTLRLTPQRQEVQLQLADAALRIGLDAAMEADNITLTDASLSAGKSSLALNGAVSLQDAMPFDLKGKLTHFNPATWIKTSPADQARLQADINMDFSASGQAVPVPPQAPPQLKLSFGIHDSRYGGLPLQGSGTLHLDGERLLPSSADLLIAGNQLHLKGSFGTAKDQLAVHIHAPQLQSLGFGLSGLLQFDGTLAGSLTRPNLRATYRAEKLVFGARRLARLSGQADLQGDLQASVSSPNNKLVLSLHAQDYHGPEATLSTFDADLSGTYAAHRLTLKADGDHKGKPLALTLAAQGRLQREGPGYAWKGVLQQLENRGWPRLALSTPLDIDASAKRLILGATQLSVADAAIDLKNFSYQDGRLRSAGSMSNLQVSAMLDLLHEYGGVTLPLKSNLVFDSQWDFSLADSGSGYLQINRKSGDLRFTPEERDIALGLSQAQLRVELHGKQLSTTARIVADRIGSLTTQADSTLPVQDGLLTLTTQMPLTAEATLSLPQLHSIGSLLGPQYVLEGAMNAKLSARGTPESPQLSGSINGDGLGFLWFDQGIQLKNGIVRMVLDNNEIDLRQVEFQGASGTLRATGKVQLGNANPALSASIIADRLQLFASPERQLMLSGQASVANVDEKLRIDGKVRVDRALFDFPKSSAPSLGDDVIVVRSNGKTTQGATATGQQKFDQASAKPASSLSPSINLDLDFGDDFRFRGRGADLRLAGNLNVKSEPNAPLRGVGLIRVAEGTYEAFGSKLNIESGRINFQGPLNNPNINILAIRSNLEVEAGVEVSGTAAQPRVKLVSTPNVSDEEKLSWIMFGHGSDSSGVAQINASSQALALLGNYGGKNLARGIGLDQFSVGASESGLTDQQVINIGKALTEKIVLGYEQSLSTAASIIKLSWQFSRRWSLVVRAGAINGLGLVFNRRYD
ncbi:translocation/assembly module TamB domain-containing protein [Herbaspirillum sp. RTI4]|uniref:translocation/assembly module TamB domain-containing protein n=1 Tax=Herbaspirillum sp. RTI4 TaxID=3048640 RepID=UPI002AB534EB|nr:translocation/assembly module TamB domain-containing protein [Herbaspirillum sp. RTI4]MDY7579812.1 translocation/assembly module TamB domain-containing protein [Herbaspirillum sp. RTI4]MEA9982583.1 translocation/assembly module TamB domain-containing protein [Herbaspirillum sp. RTI4]